MSPNPLEALFPAVSKIAERKGEMPSRWILRGIMMNINQYFDYSATLPQEDVADSEWPSSPRFYRTPANQIRHC